MRENRLRPNPDALAAKALAVLALCLLAPAVARAQWTQPDPNNRIGSTNAGVGVGTATPNYKLEVTGSPSRNTVAVTGDGDAAGYAGIKIQAQTTTGIAANRISQFNLHMRKDNWYSGDGSGPSFVIETVSKSGGFAAPFLITPQNHVILNGGRGNSGLPYGWVGVGTAAPATNFHVNSQYGFGAVRVSGAGGGLMHFQDASAPANQRLYQWRSEGGLFRMALLNDAESGWVQQNLLVATAAGNVGFGTPSPSARLHVQGGNVFHQFSAAAGQEYGFYTALGNNHLTSNLAFDGQWRMISAGRGAMVNVAPTSGFALLVGADNTARAAGGPASVTQHFAVTTDGRVGVGNTSPAYRLDVTGQVRSSSGGFVFPDGTVQTTASGGGTLTGVTAGAGLTGGGASGSPTLDIVAGAGLILAADSLSVNYGSAPGTAVEGNTTLTLTAGQGLTGGGQVTLGAGGALTLGNADRGSSQNIFKHVTDAAGAVQFSAASNDDAVSFEGAGGTTVSFNAAARRVTISSATPASGWTEAGASLSTTNAGARVGVGVGAPLGPLSVGDSSADGSDGYLVIGKKQGQGARHFKVGFDGNFNFVIGDYGAGNVAGEWRSPFAINWDAPSGALYLNADGNVGVGTATPAHKLDVMGQVRSSVGGFVFPDGTVQETAATSGLAGVTAGAGLTGGGADGSPTISVGAGAGLTAGDDSLSVNYGSAAGTAVEGNRTLTLAAGQGLTGGGQVTLGAGGSVTLENDDRGSAQNIFKHLADAAGATQFSAGSNNDALRFEGTGGTTVSFDPAAKKVTIDGARPVSFGSTAGTAVEGNTTLTLTAGDGLSGGGAFTLGAGGTLTLENADRGSAQNIFKRVTDATGATKFSAGSNNDSISFEGAGGTTVTFDSSAKKVTIGSSVPAASGWTEAGTSLRTTSASARVGVGTASPLGPLSVGDASADGSDGFIVLGKRKGPGTRQFRIGFDDNFNFVLGDYGAGNVAEAWKSPLAVNWNAPSASLYVDAGGRVGIGTANPAADYRLDVKGHVSVTGDVVASGNVQASFQDVAEWVPSVQSLRAGTVVVLDAGRTNHVVASAAAYDTKVAGVVSARPGVLLGVAGEGKVMVATTGRVRVKVDASRGAIRVGDLLVTSEVEGVAMKSVPVELGGARLHRPGTLIGKALEPLEKGTGEILVLLSLQ